MTKEDIKDIEKDKKGFELIFFYFFVYFAILPITLTANSKLKMVRVFGFLLFFPYLLLIMFPFIIIMIPLLFAVMIEAI